MKLKHGARNNAGFGKGIGMIVYIFKDGVCYLNRYYWVEKQYKITVPNYIEETEEAYINYINDVLYKNGEAWGAGEKYVLSEKYDKSNPHMVWLKLPSNGEEGYLYVYKSEKDALGDISGDGIIDTEDARDIMLHCVGTRVLSEKQKELADVNKDGLVDTEDARRILLYSIGHGEI